MRCHALTLSSNSEDFTGVPIIDRITRAQTSQKDLTRQSQRKPPPLMLKISPDLSDKELEELVSAAEACGVNGLIVGAGSAAASEDTRMLLAGAPIRGRALANVRKVHELCSGRIPIVASGGILTAEDAYAAIRAGASLVQVYSALCLDGPYAADKIARGLAALLRRDGFAHVGDAVGFDLKRRVLPPAPSDAQLFTEPASTRSNQSVC